MISIFYEKIVGGSQQESNPKKILCVGLVCLDIVQTCKNFPLEDTDTRCVEYRWQRGGNASNNCTVLSRLGSKCEFFGTLGAEHHLKFLKDDMIKYSIDFDHCPIIERIGCPISTVILSLQTGSRTILHHNPNLPELTIEDFEKLNLDNYSWIHFEGRNIPRVLGMMQLIENYNKKLKLIKSKNLLSITVSVELEKNNVELLDLLAYADVAFISKDFACSRGYSNMTETIKNIARDVKSGATIICAWGDRGAMARSPDGTIVQSPAFPPTQIVDSLGAGDTFTAAVLHYLNHVKLQHSQFKVNNTDYEKSKNEKPNQDNTCSQTSHLSDYKNITLNRNIESSEYSNTEFINKTILQSAIAFACRIAGNKIGFKGYDDLQLSPIHF
ncbi:ketohexokinase-like [Microplitis demolitor]|uniref:ketohexokinase-like n=1 Tax=Microplitis demolitor TaxID=69319 RepID=UPI0004CCDCAD|nr:ketohexokinase-like [Microplitis demolitor]XP_008553211.1 ketohexokinase-like [Microplitis demolitor]XP_053595280.1 ketohexokinase-like [Microplitis demolitor]